MTTRRSLFAALAASPALLAQPPALKGRLKQSATRGCFGRRKSLDQIATEAAQLGLKGVDLVSPKDWPILKKHGLVPTMASSAGHSLTNGINRKEAHSHIEAAFRELIDQAAASGVPNIIALSGNRRGMSDEEGAENCALFLNRVKAQAEDKGVTICLELLNKVNHPDYMCDRTAWGVDVCKGVDSPRVKLLYDIYHMQIMEGDIIRTVQNNIRYIAHFHTAGNPGRHEFDDTQEMNYHGIARALADLKFTGYVAHEYTPLKDPIQSLDEALRICDA
jgi:hydroxypyruvate isomerase